MKHYIPYSKNYYEEFFLDDKTRPCVMILPGGAYQYTSLRESEPVAKVFNAMGMHTVVVHYAFELKPFPKYTEDIAYVVRELRKDSRIMTKKLVGLGFSAGGHCVLSSTIYQPDHVDYLVLCYPVITMTGPYAHELSAKQIIPFQEEKFLDMASLEKHIPADICDTFLWHTVTDGSVPVQNSLMLIDSYTKVKANIEVHLYPMGCHGLSLATKETSNGDENKEIPYISEWVNLVKNWFKLKEIL